MIGAVRNARDLLHVPLEQAVRMASRIPAQFMGMGEHFGDIKAGSAANFIVINEALEVIESWINGER